MSKPKSMNVQIRQTLAQVGDYLTAADLADMLDAGVADVATRLSHLFKLNALVRRVSDSGKFEYRLADADAPPPAAKIKPRRVPPAPVNVAALVARIETTDAEAASEAAGEPMAQAQEPPADMKPTRRAKPSTAKGELTLPNLVSRFLGGNGVPAEPALQARAAGVIDQISLLAEDMAATDTDPDILRQLLLASRSLRAVIAPELEHNA